MGYTHYWKKLKFSESGWNALCDSTSCLLRSLPANVKVENDNGTDDPMVGAVIRFNGVESQAHETFLVERFSREFEFCKTNRKPYDLAVCSVLILVSLYAEGGEISSDGLGETYTDSEWKDAWNHVSTVIPAVNQNLEETFKLFREWEGIVK
jgi:hypothetical protein